LGEHQTRLRPELVPKTVIQGGAQKEFFFIVVELMIRKEKREGRERKSG
jgi:hypothetical protein